LRNGARRNAHVPRTSAGRSQQARLGHYLPDLVYGANDGIITMFAVVSGVVGADLSRTIILILGFANLFADGISMGRATTWLAARPPKRSRESEQGGRFTPRCGDHSRVRRRRPRAVGRISPPHSHTQPLYRRRGADSRDLVLGGSRTLVRHRVEPVSKRA
jgi:VIT family